MSLSEILNNETEFGKDPKQVIVKCIKNTHAFPNPGIQVGEIHYAWLCTLKEPDAFDPDYIIQFYRIGKTSYYDLDCFTEDFPQLEKLLFIGRNNERQKRK